VTAHAGEHDNERADKLAAEGSNLRFKLMELAAPHEWYQKALHQYWTNRNIGD
jgi:ribonuclease HI